LQYKIVAVCYFDVISVIKFIFKRKFPIIMNELNKFVKITTTLYPINNDFITNNNDE